jgi:hypothetical protein
LSDLDLIPEHAASAGDDPFSMQLIRQHLEQKSKEQTAAVTPEEPPQVPAATVAEPVAEPVIETPAAPKSEDSGGLSDADRELIGTYLRSK